MLIVSPQFQSSLIFHAASEPVSNIVNAGKRVHICPIIERGIPQRVKFPSRIAN